MSSKLIFLVDARCGQLIVFKLLRIKINNRCINTIQDINNHNNKPHLIPCFALFKHVILRLYANLDSNEVAASYRTAKNLAFLQA